ncbi:unnamed protein product [Mucor hiemalis]
MDYIKSILGHAFHRINKKKVFKKSKEEGKTVYVLTVPAIWNEDAKRIMVEAFEESKILKNEDSLLIITEPEAAAISYDRILSNDEKDNWKTFLVCDAGGGTVDLVTFRMEKDENGIKPSVSYAEEMVACAVLQNWIKILMNSSMIFTESR